MRTSDEFLTLSICIQFGIFLSTIAIGNTNAWLNSQNQWLNLIVVLGIACVGAVTAIAAAAALSGSGNAFVFMAGRLEMSAGFLIMILIYGIATSFTAAVFYSIPWGIGPIVAGLYTTFAGVVIVWDVIDRATPRGA